MVTQLIKAKKAYYNGKPIMSDVVYDKLEIQLRKTDPRHPALGLVDYHEDYEWWVEHYSKEVTMDNIFAVTDWRDK